MERITRPQINIFAPQSVALDAMLDARERRAGAQRDFLSRFRCPLLSFTMNIAGPVKDTPLIRLAFGRGMEQITDRLGPPLEMALTCGATGPEALLAYPRPAPDLKKAAEAIEEGSPVGRLFDVDVLDEAGEKLSRKTPRRCVVCGGPVSKCARSRRHGLEDVTDAITDLLRDFACGWLADRAVSALLREARFTPKPGLVDEANNGAHRDMNLPMLRRSAASLRPYFERFVQTGSECPDSFLPLQDVGLDAEAAMLKTTGGVNTHRGAVYAFGLLLGALGASLEDGKDVFDRVSALAESQPEGDSLSHGETMRRQLGAGGARMEARLGFPTARAAARVLAERGELDALLFLLLHCEDTNVLYRGGAKGLRFVRQWAQLILSLPGEWRGPIARIMDTALIRRNLSPGGCADLLALAFFMEDTGLELGG